MARGFLVVPLDGLSATLPCAVTGRDRDIDLDRDLLSVGQLDVFGMFHLEHVVRQLRGLLAIVRAKGRLHVLWL